jgi:hypothetical protein
MKMTTANDSGTCYIRLPAKLMLPKTSICRAISAKDINIISRIVSTMFNYAVGISDNIA